MMTPKKRSPGAVAAANRGERAYYSVGAENNSLSRPSAQRKKPPYHWKTAAALAAGQFARLAYSSPDGRNVSVIVACGSTAWEIGRRLEQAHALYLVAPSDTDPALFDWCTLTGHDPILLFSDDGDHDTLAAALIRDGVKRALCCRTGRRWIAGGGA
jgi:hypothetical protein